MLQQQASKTTSPDFAPVAAMVPRAITRNIYPQKICAFALEIKKAYPQLAIKVREC